MRTPIVSVIVLVLFFAGALRGQTTNATVTGQVADSSKGIITDAKVTLINEGTNIQYVSNTNQSGSYYIAELPVGKYRMEVEKLGFKSVIKPDVVLHVQDALEINFEMTVGSLSESVTVEAGAPTVQLTTSSISAVVNSATVRELPLNGRNWTDLATLQPGVEAIQTQRDYTQVDRGVRGFGSEVSISGARPQQNNYRLDGVSLNTYDNGAPGSVLGGNLGVDAIQEFSILSSNYSAEYGKTSGGVINAITRSGTNQLHGDAYEFLRNSALDARNFFDGPTIPQFKRNQFGGSLGGPIRKDRTFIFGDYEGLRQSKGITSVDTVPTSAARAGNLSTGTVTVDPSVQKYLVFWPLPNRTILPGGDLGIFTFAGQQIVNENFFTTRLDHKFSEKDNIFGTYLFDKTGYTAPDSLNDVLLGNATRRQFVVLEETHVFSAALVNSVRFGYNRESADANTELKAINPLATDLSLGAFPGKAAAEVFVGGLTTFSGGMGPGGVGGSTTYFFRWNSFQLYDDAFLTKGTHSFKFGIAVERIESNTHAIIQPVGVFTFGSLSKFLTNQPARFTGAVIPFVHNGIRQSVFGVYVQDDWRWRPNLTVNLGLRYEMATVPTEAQGRLTNVINLTDPTPHLGSPLFLNPTLHNFDPRVGFSWDPFRNGKTAVRGGFGVFDVLPLPYQFTVMEIQAAPFFALGSAGKLPPKSFFSGAFPLFTPRALRDPHIDYSPHRSYVMQWNMNIQRELARNLSATVGYVGSRGVHLPFRIEDADLVVPTLTAQGYLWPSPIGSGTVINPNFGGMKSTFYDGNSFYHSLELQLTKVMSHGLQVQGSFTWGKSIDTGSASGAGDQFGNSIASPKWFDMRLNRGPSDFNIGRTLVINATWLVPTPKSISGPFAWPLKGWQVGGIYKASDGVPFTATFGTDGDPLGSNSGDPWDFPNRLTGPGCGTLTNPGNHSNYIKTQCFAIPTAPSAAFYKANCDPTFGTFPQCFNLLGNAGRNILTGPGLSSLDFSLFKNNYIKRISENFNVQFRAEFFNIFNRVNFNVPANPNNTDIFDSTGAPTGVAGLLTSTTTTAREIQFALKLVW
jgi:hypothetical protein